MLSGQMRPLLCLITAVVAIECGEKQMKRSQDQLFERGGKATQSSCSGAASHMITKVLFIYRDLRQPRRRKKQLLRLMG